MGFFERLFGGKGDKNIENSEDSMPQNDGEKWIVAVYALWSEYCGGSCKYFGGYVKNSANASMVRGVLKDDWWIQGKEDAVENVDYLLTSAAKEENVNNGKAAFNYGCACNIAARSYLAGFLTREEMLEQSRKVVQAMRTRYHSWEEYAEQYIEGLAEGSNVGSKQDQFRAIYKRLASMPDGPYSVDWNTPL